MRLRSMVCVLWLLISLVGLDACSSHPVRTAAESDVVGTWVGDGDSVIQIGSDRTFRGRNLPMQQLASGLFGAAWTGDGTWQLKSATKYQGQRLQCAFDGLISVPIYVEWDDPRFRLFFWVGDPDEGKRYWLDKV